MKMKRNILFLILALCLALLGTASCKDKKKDAPVKTEFETGLNNADSTAVAELVDKFFAYAENRQFDEAAAMLYRTDPNHPNNAPEPLDNAAMDSVKTVLRSFPIADYTIEYMKFSESYKNEVMCRIVIAKGHDKQPDVTTKFFLNPVSYLGNWVLCLINSRTGNGDDTVVDPGKRDSIQLEYETETRLKSENAKRPARKQSANAFEP